MRLEQEGLINDQESLHADLLAQLSLRRSEFPLPGRLTLAVLAREFGFYTTYRRLERRDRQTISGELAAWSPSEDDQRRLESYTENVIDTLDPNLRGLIGEALLRIDLATLRYRGGADNTNLEPLLVSTMAEPGFSVTDYGIQRLHPEIRGDRPRVLRPQYALALAVVKTLFGPVAHQD